MKRHCRIVWSYSSYSRLIASVLGNRNQGCYNVANAALNALAEYRQLLDLPGISVALGAMSEY